MPARARDVEPHVGPPSGRRTQLDPAVENPSFRAERTRSEGGERMRQAESVQRQLDAPCACGGLRADRERPGDCSAGEVSSQIGNTQCRVDDAALEPDVAGAHGTRPELRDGDTRLHPQSVRWAIEHGVGRRAPVTLAEAQPTADSRERKLS